MNVVDRGNGLPQPCLLKRLGCTELLSSFSPKLLKQAKTTVIIQCQDRSITRLYNPMKEGRIVDWGQNIIFPSTKIARSKSEHHKWLLFYPMVCFWTPSCTGGYINNSPYCHDDSWIDQTIALTPIDSASLHCWMIFLSALMQHCFALMLIFESVRSQIPSGFCNKWDIPTDSKEELQSSSFSFLPFVPLFPPERKS